MFVEIDPKKTIEEQKKIIEDITIKTTIIDGRRVRIIPQGFSITNKIFIQNQ